RGARRPPRHVRRPRHALRDAQLRMGPGEPALGRASHDQGFVASRLTGTGLQATGLRTDRRRSRPRARLTSSKSFRPSRDRRGSLHHRPLVVAGGKDLKAVGLGALPGGAEAVLGELPGAFALGAARTDRLARHLAVGAEYHLVLDI